MNDLIHQPSHGVCVGPGQPGRSVPLLTLEGKFRAPVDEGAEVTSQDSGKDSYYPGNRHSEVPR